MKEFSISLFTAIRFVPGGKVLAALLMIGFFPLVVAPAWAQTAQQKPNIVILLADDLGWNDVSYHRSPIKTPHIDQLAHEGVELDRFYVAPWCSATRAGLMTGRYPHRYGYHYGGMPTRDAFLPLEAETLAEMLGRAGYQRRAIVGKWHLLNSMGRGGHPLDQGFNEFYGILGGSIDYFNHTRIKVTAGMESQLDWYRNRELNHDQGYATDLLGDEAVRFIQESVGSEPFFLYVPFNAPHIPLQAPGDAFLAAPTTAAQPDILSAVRHPDASRPYYFAQATATIQSPPAATRASLNPMPDGALWAQVIDGNSRHHAALARNIYAAMVSSLDSNIGKILAALDGLGLRDNTLVLFLSDNGGDYLFATSDNSPMRSGKTALWEGGVRVPAALRWPNGVAGGARLLQPISYVDILPTIAEIVGAPAHPNNSLDGVSVLSVLQNDQAPLDRRIYLGVDAMVDRYWKLVGDQLFAIETDPQESTNVASAHPEVVASFKEDIARIQTRR